MFGKTHKKVYYCVQSVFYTDGRIEAVISHTVCRRRKPADLMESRRKYDIYEDWFETRAKAQAYASAMKGKKAEQLIDTASEAA